MLGVVLEQPAGLSKEACLYAGADWLSFSVIQKVARGQYTAVLFLAAILGSGVAEWKRH